MQPSDEMDENITHWEWPVAESSQQHAERVALLQPILYDALYGIDTSHEQKSPDLLTAHKGKGLSVNVSSGGMLLLMDQSPPVQQVFEIQVPVSTTGKTPVLVEVCWTRQISIEDSESRYLVGVKFLFDPAAYYQERVVEHIV